MRFFSTILFALMAMVLPMAGVQRNFCTMSMAFAVGAKCPSHEKDCCQETQCSAKPECFVSAKLLPDAETAMPVQLPDVSGLWSVLPASMANLLPGVVSANVSPAKDSAPPDRPRLFLAQERLLI